MLTSTSQTHRNLTQIIVCSSTLLLTALPAAAHQEAIDAGWCADGRIVVLGQHTLQGKLLQLFRDPKGSLCQQTKTCGEFDDYTTARKVAEQQCLQYSEVELAGLKSGDASTVRPIFHSPAVFKNYEKNHHTLYQLSQGISFSCAICVVDQASPLLQDK